MTAELSGVEKAVVKLLDAMVDDWKEDWRVERLVRVFPLHCWYVSLTDYLFLGGMACAKVHMMGLMKGHTRSDWRDTQ